MTKIDDITNITVQFKKALDVGGNYAIQFVNGESKVIAMSDIIAFLNKYDQLKPIQRSDMQSLAIQSPAKFNEVLNTFIGDKAEPSIY